MLITIAAITYNEAEHIPFWYEQHRELADQFIICDTGSYDNTEEVANKLKIPFVKIPWQHNFAQAKNFALRHAKADWIFLQSPDFWMDKRNFDKIKNELYGAFTTGVKGFAIPSMAVREFGKPDLPLEKVVAPNDWIAETHICLFRNDPKLFYEHRVHENIHESIFREYGRNAMKILPYIRYHHTTAKIDSNQAKLEYYAFLESIVETEGDLYGRAQNLRKKAYDYEL